MNVLAYSIYLLITYFVTVHVGKVFYRNGRGYILNLLAGDETTTDSINKILLTGYYLLNLGYAALMIRFWNSIYTYEELVLSIGIMTGRILLSLALIHFFNMIIIYLLSNYKKSIHHHKT